jgi:hypothetical protein
MFRLERESKTIDYAVEFVVVFAVSSKTITKNERV